MVSEERSKNSIDVRREGRAVIFDERKEERRKSYLYINLYVYYIERWELHTWDPITSDRLSETEKKATDDLVNIHV